ncbi:hypothetical protein EZ313_08140 [Ramlibacter henchirensis]|uniref:MEDS domain-containing protein n=1 Tax=Ramlibacter henchirensis TaxID=204072 RepID=A0A4Z0C4I0_9BURK|nr:MEDS domain-containing protein [Ramlibacter henchirensis]TFZ06587.1 hypothetical protein EZ313_08140 [Ramlibacter henchirensis]
MRLMRSGDEVKAFWAELKPCDHLVEMYEAEGDFLDSLESYVHDGLVAGDSVVLIATEDHLGALEQRLAVSGVDLNAARKEDRYIELDAEETLAKFMVNGWPDEERFKRVVGDLLGRAGANGANVRAFGEMVAFLWAKKLYAATVRLEHLWHRFCAEEGFSLLCAYPVSGPTSSSAVSMREICQAHSHVITKSGVAPV